MNLSEYFSKAQLKQSSHKRFLEKLKAKKPKKLEDIVQNIHNETFEKISCLECANCCKTTGPLFTKQDVERISKKLRLKEIEFQNKYLNLDEDNDWVLNQLPCVFLGSDNKCIIYEFRPKACKEFPHTDRKKIYQINHLTLKNTLICPAAYEVVEKMMEKIKL